ncbi:MAG: amino acid adenylation domain-containing protein [Blastocatellia bacterium]|nr:amino acid adenylation domain-containing protein [Blastocatellia bacterium]
MSSLLQQLVTGQAEQRPDQVAIVHQKERMTYGELEETSNRLARLLKQAGCQKGDRVCFLMPKTPAAIATILGILKADCVYVPLDPSSPAARVEKIVEACTPRFILGNGSVTPLLDELMAEESRRNGTQIGSRIGSRIGPRIGWMGAEKVEGANFKAEFAREDLNGFSAAPLDYLSATTDAAHILFTSGSTGVPKGVVITHTNVLHYVDWAVKYFGTVPEDKVSFHPPLHFDLSTYDIYGTLSAGAQLHIVPTELNLAPQKLAGFIRESELTQWFSVPSVLNFMAKADVVKPNDFPTLKRLMWCGEVFPTPPLIYWMQRLPSVQFTNLYGPTEATIASSYYTVPACPPDETTQIPIGLPCAGEELIVLDEHLKPVPTGEIGDLYIAGVGLSPGYWLDPEKTAAVFLPRPGSADPNDRIYKTGDLAKMGEDGLVYYLGRADSQIKSRGYRIELGEIETALNALALTEECAIVAIETGGFEGATICCAYVPLPDVEITPARLRTEMSKALPNYMLPARWMRFDRLPKNANGKIDRRKLKEDFQQNGT